MDDLIRLEHVYYDSRAKDGTWCMLPYPNHPKGCPNFPKCPSEHLDFRAYQYYEWFAVVEEFDLGAHAQRMKDKHPGWTRRQCRNLLYWQGGVRKRLREKAQAQAEEIKAHIILQIPEATGVDVYKTMKEHGLELRPDPDIVYKIMILGRRYPKEERYMMPPRMHTIEVDPNGN